MLNPKQRRFAELCASDAGTAEAYAAAFGCGKAAARSGAARLLKRSDVQKAIRRGKKAEQASGGAPENARKRGSLGKRSGAKKLRCGERGGGSESDRASERDRPEVRDREELEERVSTALVLRRVDCVHPAMASLLTIEEKRVFLARIVRARVAELPEDSDLWISVKRTEKTAEFRLPDKLAAIKADNDLAGEGAEASGGDALAGLLGRIRQ